MFPILVLEEVVDTLLLHQPADEVEVGFAVLDTVFERTVLGRQRVFEIGKTFVTEDLLDDVGNRHLLEDAAIRLAREEPEPRIDRRRVTHVITVTPGLAEIADVAVEVTDAAVRQVQFDRQILAEHVVEGEIFFRAEEFELVLEESAQFFVRIHSLEEQILSKRRVHANRLATHFQAASFLLALFGNWPRLPARGLMRFLAYFQPRYTHQSREVKLPRGHSE